MVLPLLVFVPMLMGILAYAAGRRSKPLRTALVILTCAAAFGGTLLLWKEEHVFNWEGFCGMGIHLRADGFRSFYASVAAFMWLARKEARPPSWVWPKASLAALALPYSLMNLPSLSWMPSDTTTRHFFFWA